MKAQVNHISDQLAIWSSRAFRILGLWIVALAVIAVSNHKLDELRLGVESMPAGYVSTTEKIKQLLDFGLTDQDIDDGLTTLLAIYAAEGITPKEQHLDLSKQLPTTML